MDWEELGITSPSQALINADTSVRKSQIAIEYAYRFQQTRPQSHVFWVYAASYGTFLQACHDISLSLKLPACDDLKADPCELVSKWLHEEDHSWLMILDNADNAELLFPSAESDSPSATVMQTQRALNDYLPGVLNSQKSLLFTTRSRLIGQDLAYGELCVEVPPLSPQEATELLQLKAKGAVGSFDKHRTEILLDVLGYNPLAITQAAAFMNRNRMTIQSYLADLERDKQNLADYLSQELQDPRRPRGFPNSVFRTWRLSFDQILALEPQTARLLSIMVMLDPQRIPEKLLRRLVEREVEFRMAIGTLDGFALISQEIGGETYAIHPLVQASVHHWLEQRSEKADYAGQALQLLAEAFPNGRHEHKETCESMLAHAQAVLCHKCTSENDMGYRAALLCNVGCFNWRQGRYVSAYEAASESYNIYQERTGDVATARLDSLSLLASVLRDQGKYEAAEEMNRRALKGYEKVLGVEHPATLTSVHNLAYLFHYQQRYHDASSLYLRASAGFQKTLGLEHPITQNCLQRYESLINEVDSQGGEI